MPRKLDPAIADVLKRFGFGPDAAWDCHGTWVVYHRVLEQIAAKAGIAFDPPLVLEANGAGKVAALCVTGRLGDRAEWSIGEASPANNKNAYPFAMAEKRAKDRVILKLAGLHGLAYSEEEADEFKGDKTQANVASAPPPARPIPAEVGRSPDAPSDIDRRMADSLIVTGKQSQTNEELNLWWKMDSTKATFRDLPPEEQDRVTNELAKHRQSIKARAA